MENCRHPAACLLQGESQLLVEPTKVLTCAWNWLVYFLVQYVILTFTPLGWGIATAALSLLALLTMCWGFDIEDAYVIVALCKARRRKIWDMSNTSQWARSRAKVWGTVL
jgi:hypothetical protein